MLAKKLISRLGINSIKVSIKIIKPLQIEQFLSQISKFPNSW